MMAQKLRQIPSEDLPQYYLDGKADLLGEGRETSKIYLFAQDCWFGFEGRCAQLTGSSGCLVVDDQGRVFYGSKHAKHGLGHVVSGAKPAGRWFAFWHQRRIRRAFLDAIMLRADLHQGPSLALNL